MSERQTHLVSIREGLEVELVDLNGFEIKAANRFLNQPTNDADVMTTYSICAIRKLNGRKVEPLASELDFRAVAEAFGSRDVFALYTAYGKLFSLPEGEKLKKDSESSPESLS